MSTENIDLCINYNVVVVNLMIALHLWSSSPYKCGQQQVAYIYSESRASRELSAPLSKTTASALKQKENQKSIHSTRNYDTTKYAGKKTNWLYIM